MIPSFDYHKIVSSVLDGTTESFYFIATYKYEARSNGELDQVDLSYVFAGTTMEECRQTMDSLVLDCKPYEDERYNFLACRYPVCADMFKEFDSECDDAEEFALNFFTEEVVHSSGWEELNEGSWCDQTIDYKHDSLVDSIVIYWQWHTYVGYARKPIRLEYCIDENLTTQNCIEKDSTSATQLTCLVSAKEVKECITATELRDLIEKRISLVDKWQTNVDVDAFVRELYESKERFGSLYALPLNNL